MSTVTGSPQSPSSHGTLRIEREPRPLVIRRHDAVIAASKDAFLVHGMSETPIYYVPSKDVYFEQLVEVAPSAGSNRPDARFWSVTASGGGVDSAVWMLTDPSGELAQLNGYVGFDPNPFNITLG